MKIKPDDLAIPCNDPFRHDLLGRKQPAQILTNLLRNQETPYTISIDASWGNGKTTFLNMWKQHLKNQNFAVVGFNAWETDFAQYPLIALTSELLHSLNIHDYDGDLGLDAVAATLPRFLEVALTKAVPWTISAAGVIGAAYVNDPMAALAGQTLAAGVSGTMEEVVKTEPSDDLPEPLTYIKAKEEINLFRNALANTAEKLSERHDGRPLIIAIDELDRCRPSYAVELLEIVKHFFSVDNIVFVLAIDKSQLSHAIKALYGNEFDSIGYLRRFIDLDFRLPKPDQTNFVNHSLRNAGVHSSIDQHKIDYISPYSSTRGILADFLNAPSLSLRQIQQVTVRLGLALSSVETDRRRLLPAFVLMIVLRTFDLATYHQFIRSEITDRQVSDYMFGLPGMRELRKTIAGVDFEAILILAYDEFRGVGSSIQNPSPLYDYYNTTEKNVDHPLHAHAQKVLASYKKYLRDHGDYGVSSIVGFKAAAKHIELLDEILPVDYA